MPPPAATPLPVRYRQCAEPHVLCVTIQVLRGHTGNVFCVAALATGQVCELRYVCVCVCATYHIMLRCMASHRMHGPHLLLQGSPCTCVSRRPLCVYVCLGPRVVFTPSSRTYTGG